MTFTVNFERFYTLTLKRKPEKRKPFSKKTGVPLFSKSTKIENFHTKTTLSQINVKTNRLWSTKWAYHKERTFATNYLIFSKILFQLKTLYKELI